jgi:hypothetical protein
VAIGLLIGIVFLIIFSLLGISLLIYSIRKKSRIGLLISTLILLISISFIFGNYFDEWTIKKSDVIEDLKHLNIQLKDDFEISNNEVTGMPERIQTTEIIISNKDKEQIVNEIKNSKNFKSYSSLEEIVEYATNEKQILNYKRGEFYSRELYSEIDNYPTRLIIYVYESSNKLRYNRIED